MRTVDPDQWYTKVRKAPIHLTRPMRFGLKPDDVEMRIRNSFYDALKDYWRHCSVEGVQRVSDRNLSKFERYCYAVMVILVLWVGVSMLTYNLYQLGTAPPMQINLKWEQHSIQRMPFPAVALCSTNIISKGPLMSYTRFLDASDQNNTYHLWSIRKHLLKFGALVTMDIPPVDVMFMKFLAHADPNFNVTRLMYQLSSSCSSTLLRCSWRGRVTPCERLFATRITPLGFCCVFNSRYSTEDIHRPPSFLSMVGRDYGLAVVVQENTDDFAFTRRASYGLEVLLFEGSDYPILAGGGVRIYPVARNASVFMSVTASAQYIVGDGTVRACRRRSVGGPPSARSYAWCLAQCRRRSLATLCGCQLHTFVPNPEDTNPVCSLTHLPCLNKHKEKLIYYYPHGYTSDAALSEELQNGLFCSDCEPDCTRVVYSASTATAPYSNNSNEKIFKNLFTKGISLVNSSVIRVFYSSEHQQLYGVETNVRWFETFATISSQWSIIVGATMIAGSELVYHCTIRWLHHYRRRTRVVLRFSDAE